MITLTEFKLMLYNKSDVNNYKNMMDNVRFSLISSIRKETHCVAQTFSNRFISSIGINPDMFLFSR